MVTLSQIVALAEKRSQTNLRKLSKEWSWLMFARITGIALALLLASVYARYLSQEEYGAYKYVLSVFDILAIFTLQGMEDASQKAIAQGKDAVFWDTFKLRNLFGTLTTLCAAGVGMYYLLNQNYTLGLIFLTSAPFLVFLKTSSHYNTLLMGRQLFKQISINNTLIQISTSGLLILAVILTSNLYWLVAAFLFSGIFFSTLGFLHTIRKNKLNNEHDPSALSYGKHMSVLGVASTVTAQATPFLLWHLLGPTQLAIYAFALAAVAQINGMFKLLTTSMAFSKLSKLDVPTLKSTLPRKVLLAHLVTIPVAAGMVTVIPLIYKILFPTYMESVIYAQAMTLLLAFSPMRFYLTAIMTHGSPRAVHSYNVSGSIFQLASLFIFIPLFGIWGVIIASVLTQTITNFVVMYFFKRM